MKFQGFSTENKLVCTLTADISSLSKDLLESHDDRLSSRGGHFTRNQMIPVYCAAVSGYDDDDSYNNFLFELKEELVQSDKPVLLKVTEFDNPTPDETAGYTEIDRSDRAKMIDALCAKIRVDGDEMRTKAASQALRDMLEESTDSNSKLFNTAVKLSAWFRRLLTYLRKMPGKNDIPIIFYYGNISQLELKLLHLMCLSGFDVLYTSPDKSTLQMLKENNYRSQMQIFENKQSKEVMPFPDKAVRTKLATVAYNAERELDVILYGGDTIFRDFQFSDMESAVMKTTFDEIDVMWHQQSRYRSGFQVRNNRVMIPTFFAKVSGVRDGNMNDYWEYVRERLSPMTILSIKGVTYDRSDTAQVRAFDPYHDGHTVFADKLKNSKMNKYGFLSDELQTLIIGKIQESFDSGYLFNDDERELLAQIMFTAMNLDRSILRILQKYDFTKDVPKFIVVDTIEDTFSLRECIRLVLLNMLGFDILVFTPTGYRNIETHISEKAFENHMLNEFKYNVSVPKFKIPDKIPVPKQKSGLFGLFKKERRY